MAGQDATSILDQLLPYFEEPEAAARVGEHALELARQVYAVARDPSLEACNTGGGLERRMLALAQALTAWAPQAAGALETWIGNLDTQPVVLVPLTTAFNCLAAIANMASRLSVQPGAAFRIAAACQLVFGAGRLSVVGMMAKLEAAKTAGQSQPQFQSMLATLSRLQLEAAARAVQLLQRDGLAHAATAFARSTARPATLLPWLAEVSRAVLALRTCLDEELTAGSNLIRAFAAFLCLLETDTFAEHAAAMAADAVVPDAIAAALFISCLKYVAAQCGEAAAAGLLPGSQEHFDTVFILAHTVQIPVLAPAVMRHMQGPSAAATLRHAAGIVAATAALPADLPACQMHHTVAGDDSYDGCRPPSAEAQAACAAHVPAASVLAGLAAAAVSANSGSAGQDVGPELVDLVSSLWLALRAVPSLAGAAALAPIEALLSALPQDDTSTRIKAGIVITLAEDSILSGRWAAVLARSGLLAAGMDAAARLLSSNEANGAELAFQTLAQIAAVLSALTTAAEAVLHEGVASGMPDSLAAQLGAAASAVQEPLQVLLRHVTENVDGGLNQLMVQLRPLLQPAADLAALMQQYYALPEIDQPHRLAVAQAAAGRCCAYLRCANVGGEGGPAAGKGVGSKRCSACRAVWYCGTACSHADWREGGHRCVCRALGAARAAEKEARRAAEAAAAGHE